MMQNVSYNNTHSHSLLNQNFLLAIAFQSTAPNSNLSALSSLGVGLGVRISWCASFAISSLVDEFKAYIASCGGG